LKLQRRRRSEITKGEGEVEITKEGEIEITKEGEIEITK
jgi:hypothetical protein